MATEISTAETTEQSQQVTRTTSGPERLMLFLKDVRAEMRKVITPSRAEVQSTTIIVVFTVFLFAAYFELVDLTLGRGVDKILLHLTKH